MSVNAKFCELCLWEEGEEGTIKHKIKECQQLERIELSTEDIMKDQRDQMMEKWLRKIEK